MKKSLFSLKNTRLYIALALAIQSFTFFVMFIILCAKKKSIAAAFLAVSAMGGGTSAYLLYQIREEMRDGLDAAREGLENAELDLDDGDLAYDGYEEGEAEPTPVIPREEHVSEEEFQ